ncbi:hypothetical protein SESBI_33087 [Sesbania bispinosa]|nr:hypothetical protein SESBI_33087 [Sesbania bispinosa]
MNVEVIANNRLRFRDEEDQIVSTSPKLVMSTDADGMDQGPEEEMAEESAPAGHDSTQQINGGHH